MAELQTKGGNHGKALEYFRRILSSKQETFIDEFVMCHLIQLIVQSLAKEQATTNTLLDAVWALTNILCRGERETHWAVAAGAIQNLMWIAIWATDVALRNQAIWALSNIAGDCDRCRAELLKNGFIHTVVYKLTHTWSQIKLSSNPPANQSHPHLPSSTNYNGEHGIDGSDDETMESDVEDSSCLSTPLSLPQQLSPNDPFTCPPTQKHTILLRNAHITKIKETEDSLRTIVWALSNICRGPVGAEQLVQIVPALPILHSILMDPSISEDIKSDATWTFSYLADGDVTAMQAVIATGVCPLLVSFLDQKEGTLLRGSLRTLGNLLTGGDLETQAVLDAGIIPKFLGLLSKDVSLQREALWSLSNITAGTHTQIDAVLEYPRLLSEILLFTMNSEKSRIGKEGGWTLCNAVTGGTDEQIDRLVGCGVIPALGNILEGENDARCISATLEALNIICLHYKTRIMRLMIHSNNTLSHVRMLCRHAKVNIRIQARNLIRRYPEVFSAEDVVMNGLTRSGSGRQISVSPAQPPRVFLIRARGSQKLDEAPKLSAADS